MNGTLDYLADCKAQRMAYWDRAKVAKDHGLVFTVYVPRGGALSTIKRGSGIVGVKGHGVEDRTLIYYEGDVYRMEDKRRPYEELVYHAADRMAVDYPTIAKAMVKTTDLLEVGTFDYATQRLVVTDQAALDAWRA